MSCSGKFVFLAAIILFSIYELLVAEEQERHVLHESNFLTKPMSDGKKIILVSGGAGFVGK